VLAGQIAITLVEWLCVQSYSGAAQIAQGFREISIKIYHKKVNVKKISLIYETSTNWPRSGPATNDLKSSEIPAMVKGSAKQLGGICRKS
jgi:hypothetical protein